jgi:hypothetical protein
MGTINHRNQRFEQTGPVATGRPARSSTDPCRSARATRTPSGEQFTYCQTNSPRPRREACMQRAILSATCINLCFPESNLLRRPTGPVPISANLPGHSGRPAHTMCNLPGRSGRPAHTMCNLSGHSGRPAHTMCNLPGHSGRPAHTMCNLPGHSGRPAHTMCNLPGHSGRPAHTMCNLPGRSGRPAHAMCNLPGRSGRPAHIIYYPFGTVRRTGPKQQIVFMHKKIESR